MNSISLNILEQRDYSRLLKVLTFVAISNTLVIFWDINGLSADPTPLYFSIKAFFILTPFALAHIYKQVKSVREFIQPLICLIFFSYGYYYTSTIHYSYYTSFIQFFFGCVFLMSFSLRTFIFCYLVGIILFHLSVQAQQATLDPAAFAARSADMWGAILPAYFISLFAFFYIKNRERQDETKSLFFEKIGQDVGFLIHEFKRPINELAFKSDENYSDRLYELLETANLMWPSRQFTQEIKMREVDLKSELTNILDQYEIYIKSLNITVHLPSSLPVIKSNRTMLNLIFKNLIKNAIEELKHDEIKDKVLKIESKSTETDLKIVVSNTKRKHEKIKIKNIFDAGYSTKNSISNKGIGLYICKQLAERLSCPMNATSSRDHFSIELAYSLKESSY